MIDLDHRSLHLADVFRKPAAQLLQFLQDVARRSGFQRAQRLFQFRRQEAHHADHIARLDLVESGGERLVPVCRGGLLVPFHPWWQGGVLAGELLHRFGGGARGGFTGGRRDFPHAAVDGFRVRDGNASQNFVVRVDHGFQQDAGMDPVQLAQDFVEHFRRRFHHGHRVDFL